MFHLTTRMNALARITIGGANIAATTALQARPPAHSTPPAKHHALCRARPCAASQHAALPLRLARPRDRRLQLQARVSDMPFCTAP